MAWTAILTTLLVVVTTYAAIAQGAADGPPSGQTPAPQLPAPGQTIPEQILPDNPGGYGQGDSDGSLSERLNESDGVIVPPSTGSPMAVPPPVPNPGTTPVIPPSAVPDAEAVPNPQSPEPRGGQD